MDTSEERKPTRINLKQFYAVIHFCSVARCVYLEVTAWCRASLNISYRLKKKPLNVCELFAMIEHFNADELYY